MAKRGVVPNIPSIPVLVTAAVSTLVIVGGALLGASATVIVACGGLGFGAVLAAGRRDSAGLRPPVAPLTSFTAEVTVLAPRAADLAAWPAAGTEAA
ncbi:MAG: hypothetical protein AB1673_07665 [Actinomycetota bacterium]